ncbi:MAG: hypothetical protein AB2374_14220 [Cytobacillus gottheilii]|uniref:hypothetical protein n=1 Tax=Cytobacillus gottheilii TaxID=859144 RepID=UPI000835BF03|nr:hypothetical protein [Cytobacillus gottheilii]
MNHKQTTNDDQNRSYLGQNTKRFPINRNKSKHFYKESGIIHQIGTDYVDLLQRDHTVVRVLTRHVKKIKWVDHHCRNKCLDHVDFEKACRGRDDHLSCFVCSQHHGECHCDVSSRKRFIHSYLDKHCSHCQKHHRDCRCGKQFNTIKDPVIPYCDERIQLRLAGLTDSFLYKLFKHKGCRVVLELDLSETLD